jgi:hypothetical protein
VLLVIIHVNNSKPFNANLLIVLRVRKVSILTYLL